MLLYFNELTQQEIELFVNQIKCENLSVKDCEIFYSVDKMYKKFFKGRYAIVIEMIPGIAIGNKTELFDTYTKEELEYNKFSILISNRGIFNKKKIFFRRKRREDLEEIFLNYLVKRDRDNNLKTTTNLKQFSFSKFGK